MKSTPALGSSKPSSALASSRIDRCACTVLIVSLGILLLPVLLGFGLKPRSEARKSRYRESSFQLPGMDGSWVAPASIKGGRPELVISAESGADSAHGSTLVTTPRGGVVCAWFGGEKEGASDVGIYAASRTPQGEWTHAVEIAKVSDEAHWNPVLFWFPAPGKASPQGKLWLHFKVGNQIPHWRTYVTSSEDMGGTWAEPKELVPGDKRGGRGCVKNKPLVLAGPKPARLVAGASLEDGDWRAFMDLSEDGESWEAGKVIPVATGDRDVGLIQPTLWQSGEQTVHAFFRSDAGYVYRADSQDGGRSWGKGAYRTDLPNNNSGIDVARLRDGTLLLAYNPVSGEWGARYPLRIAMSEDNGLSWSLFWDVETDRGEFSYPAIIPWDDPAKGVGFALTYTWNRENVGFVSMSLEDFRDRASKHTGK